MKVYYLLVLKKKITNRVRYLYDDLLSRQETWHFNWDKIIKFLCEDSRFLKNTLDKVVDEICLGDDRYINEEKLLSLILIFVLLDDYSKTFNYDMINPLVKALNKEFIKDIELDTLFNEILSYVNDDLIQGTVRRKF